MGEMLREFPMLINMMVAEITQIIVTTICGRKKLGLLGGVNSPPKFFITRHFYRRCYDAK